MGEIADGLEDTFLSECGELGIDPRHWLAHDPIFDGDFMPPRKTPIRLTAIEAQDLFDRTRKGE